MIGRVHALARPTEAIVPPVDQRLDSCGLIRVVRLPQRVRVNGRDPSDAELPQVELENLENDEWHVIARMLVYGVAEHDEESVEKHCRAAAFRASGPARNSV